MYLKWSVIAFGLNILLLLLRLQAHKIYERIHDINMTNLNAETIGQVNVAKNCITVLMMLIYWYWYCCADQYYHFCFIRVGIRL